MWAVGCGGSSPSIGPEGDTQSSSGSSSSSAGAPSGNPGATPDSGAREAGERDGGAAEGAGADGSARGTPPGGSSDGGAGSDATGRAVDAADGGGGAEPDGGLTGADGSTSAVDGGAGGSCTQGSFPDAFQQHNLDGINAYRTAANLPPYALDPQLSAFACAGSIQLSMDHSPHQHFIDAENARTLLNHNGFHSAAAENQGDPNGWRVLSSDPTTNEDSQIDQILAAMYAEGPQGGHYQNMMSTTYKRVGVGLLEVSGKLYLTNDFSN